MDRASLEKSIATAWASVQLLDLGETFSNGGSLEVASEFRDLILDPNSPYEDIFLHGLRQSHYNFLLSDHSYFQFTWNNLNDVRYAYYPNPYLGSDAALLLSYKKKLELLQCDMITYEEFLQLLGEAKGNGRKPVIRYENAPRQYKEAVHPCSHLHIGLHGDDRWAVRRLLSPSAFTLLILKNYYGDQWRLSEKLEGNEHFTQLDEQLVLARGQSRLIEDDFFSAREGSLFHFS